MSNPDFVDHPKPRTAEEVLDLPVGPAFRHVRVELTPDDLGERVCYGRG